MNTNTVRVGFGVRPGDPFWVQVRESVEQRAQELDLTLVPVPLPEFTHADDSLIDTIEELKVQELGALIMHVLPERFLLAILNEGLPIVCSEDTTLTHPLLVSVHGLAQAAIMAAEYLVQEMNGCGHVLMVGADGDGSPTARLRIEGFSSILARYGGMRCTHAGVGWTYDQGLESLLRESERWAGGFADHHIDAIFGLSDSLALAGRDAARILGMLDASTLVVGINGDPLALAAIQTGTMHATIETSPERLGADLAEFGLRAAQRQVLPDHFPYVFELVTAANITAVAMRKLLAIAQIPSRLVNVNFMLEQQRITQMKTSVELNQRVGSILDQDELLAEMAEIIRARYEYEQAQLFVWSQGERTLVRVQERRADDEPLAIPLAQSGALGHALLHNQFVYIPDVPNSKRFAPDARWPDLQSRVILPVHVGGRIVGVLDLHSQRRTLRNQAELDALQILADELGTAMRNAQLYAQAIQARADAVQAGLLRSRLFAHVSHQLRTPLNVILGYSQSAVEAATADDDLRARELVDDLQYIEHSGFDLQRLIDDLLDLAQAEAGVLQLHKQRSDPKQLIDEIFVTAARTWAVDTHVRWRLQLPAQLPSVFVDQVRLRNALVNLLDNAAKHTERGQIVLGAERLESRLHVWVQDTGCGMAPETLMSVRRNMMHGVGASNLRTVDTERLGLGLAIAYHVISLHGGDLQIDSSEGRGTTCHLFLPFVDEATAQGTDGNDGSAIRVARVHAPDQLSAQLVKKAQDYIATHFATEITREEIADALGVSPSYVSRVFRRYTGMALWDYVNSFRITRARELLEHSDMTVTEVAFAAGFNEPAYFSRMFRKFTGKSPRHFRSNN
jgi:signal transduction histidine kinase/AraC-like DNA-binding protein